MWEHLANRINGACDTNKTGLQVSKRYQALIQRKKDAVNKNKTSGAVRTRIEYQEELDRIAAKDDSVEPEVLRGVDFVQYKEVNKENVNAKKPRWDKPTKKGIFDNLSETMLSIEKRRLDREAQKSLHRNERHKLTMELLGSLIKK